MPTKRGALLGLLDVAKRSEAALKKIARAATISTRLRTAALYASIGFVVGAGATYGGLIATGTMIYGLFFVPAGGLLGLLVGALLGRDGIDRSNERAADLIEQAWALRDREIATIKREIKEARRIQSPGLPLLDQKLTFLMLAPPQQLVKYYNLADRQTPIDPKSQVRLGPTDADIAAAWQPAPPALEDNSSSP